MHRVNPLTIRVATKQFFGYLSGFKETKENKEELIFLIKFKSKTLKIKLHKALYQI